MGAGRFGFAGLERESALAEAGKEVLRAEGFKGSPVHLLFVSQVAPVPLDLHEHNIQDLAELALFDAQEIGSSAADHAPALGLEVAGDFELTLVHESTLLLSSCRMEWHVRQTGRNSTKQTSPPTYLPR